MTKDSAIKLCEDRKVRSICDDDQEKWYFSKVAVLTETDRTRKYCIDLKVRLKKEGSELS